MEERDEGRGKRDDARSRNPGRPPARPLRRTRPALLAGGVAAALLAAPGPAAAQEDWPPKFSLFGGAFTVKPEGLLQLDLGTTFGHTRPGGPGGGFNPRRARLGVDGEILDDFEYAFI